MRRTLACLALLLVVVAGTATAQELSAGVRAGATFPGGVFGDSASTLSTGWNVGVVARVEFGSSRFGVQFDGGYSANSVEDGPGGLVSDWQAGVGLVFNFLPMSANVRPYVLLGGGVDYWQDDDGNGIVPAFYGSAGFDLPLDPIMPYAEVQYRYVLTPGSDLRTIQLMLGVRYLFGYR
jgi:hypothetical protein